MHSKGKLPFLVMLAGGLLIAAAFQIPVSDFANPDEPASICGESLSGIWMAELAHDWKRENGLVGKTS